MAIAVKLDDILHDRRMTLTELAERIDITLANLRLTALESDIAFQEYRRQLMLTLSQAESAYWNLYYAQEQLRFFKESISVAESIAPAILWVDEIDKAFAGSQASGMSDGGTTARVFGTFLTWLSEKTAPVFVVATANDVSQLPPELLRKGRWDEMFFVDLPNQEERQEIWRIQVAKHGRDWQDYDVAQLAKATEGFTGSEIEAVFVEALYRGFDDDQEPTDLTVAEVLTDFGVTLEQANASAA